MSSKLHKIYPSGRHAKYSNDAVNGTKNWRLSTAYEKQIRFQEADFLFPNFQKSFSKIDSSSHVKTIK